MTIIAQRTNIILITLIFIVSCTPSINNVAPLTNYSLYFQKADISSDQSIYDFVKIDLPHISTKHMTESIIYSEKPFQKNNYTQSQWKDPLPIMLQEWMVQSINEMKLFKGVIRVASRANVPLMLETDIVQFEHVVYKDEVSVSLRVILIQYNQRKIIKQKLFNYHIKVPEANAEAAVLSFNDALKQFNQELYEWLSKKSE